MVVAQSFVAIFAVPSPPFDKLRMNWPAAKRAPFGVRRPPQSVRTWPFLATSAFGLWGRMGSEFFVASKTAFASEQAVATDNCDIACIAEYGENFVLIYPQSRFDAGSISNRQYPVD
jgi:hypothetical protein